MTAETASLSAGRASHRGQFVHHHAAEGGIEGVAWVAEAPSLVLGGVGVGGTGEAAAHELNKV